ncbi:hypothetical protein CJ430_30980, partial [Klebsiella pneumoniae]
GGIEQGVSSGQSETASRTIAHRFGFAVRLATDRSQGDPAMTIGAETGGIEQGVSSGQSETASRTIAHRFGFAVRLATD